MKRTITIVTILLAALCTQAAELDEIAKITRKLEVPMRDGIKLSTDVYLPAEGEGPFPTIFWRTPYNYNKLSGSRAPVR